MADNVAEWFGLKRSNFILDPRNDAGFYAPRTGVSIPTLLDGIQVNLVTDRPPKRFFWGIYGGGKTHTLFHISWLLQEKLQQDIFPVYVECPSVPKRSTFLDLYQSGIMASIGQDFILGLFRELIDSMGTVRFEPLLTELKEILKDEELARAVSSLLGARPDKELAFWRYISGSSVPARDLSELNLTQSLAETISSRLADIVVILGRVVRRIRKKTLVLIIDELDRMMFVTDEFGISTYQEAFRRLVDENQREVSVFMGCSAGNLRELPDVFGAPEGPILSRIGTHNLIPVSEISPTDVDVFILKILEHVVDRSVAAKKLTQIKDTETLKLELFPFTTESIEALKGTLRGTMTPREITQRMSDAAGKAFIMKKNVVTSDITGGQHG
jgi:hypothetical protein